MTYTDEERHLHAQLSGEPFNVPITAFSLSHGADEYQRKRWNRDPANNGVELAVLPAGLLAHCTPALAFIDVDTKNGANPDDVLTWLDVCGVDVWAQIRTPSGGWHYYVAGSEHAPNVAATADHDGLSGLPGVEIKALKGSGVYLPGSVRPKYDGRGYEIVENRLDELAALTQWEREALGDVFADAVKDRLPRKANQALSRTQTVPKQYLGGDVTPWLRVKLERRCEEVRTAITGTRNNTLNAAAYNLGHYLHLYPPGMVEQELLDAGLASGMDEARVRATLRSALGAGANAPMVPPERPQTSPERLPAPQPNWGEYGLDDDDDDNDGPSSYAPVDLTPFLDGTYQPTLPTILRMTNGVCLLYPGLTHSIVGASEQGKSFIAQLASAQVLAAGGRVLYLDHESRPVSVVERLRTLGAPDADIRARFDYVHPEQKPGATARTASDWKALLATPYQLVILDGVTAALSLFGFSSNDNDEVLSWIIKVPNKLARKTGAAVVMIDHVSKNTGSDNRHARGAASKLEAIGGAAYLVTATKPLGRGLRGELSVSIVKDKEGQLRQHAAPPKGAAGLQLIARFVLDAEGDLTRGWLEPVKDDDGRPFRPTSLMERISDRLKELGVLSGHKLKKAVGGRGEYVDSAISVLVQEGYVEVSSGPRNSTLHALIKPYTQADDPLSDRYVPREQVEGFDLSLNDLPPVPTLRVGNREQVRSPIPGTGREQVGNSGTGGAKTCSNCGKTDTHRKWSHQPEFCLACYRTINYQAPEVTAPTVTDMA